MGYGNGEVDAGPHQLQLHDFPVFRHVLRAQVDRRALDWNSRIGVRHGSDRNWWLRGEWPRNATGRFRGDPDGCCPANWRPRCPLPGNLGTRYAFPTWRDPRCFIICDLRPGPSGSAGQAPDCPA